MGGNQSTGIGAEKPSTSGDNKQSKALRISKLSTVTVPPLNIPTQFVHEEKQENRDDITILWVGQLPQKMNKKELAEKIKEANNSVQIYDDLASPGVVTNEGFPLNCMKDSLEDIQIMEKEKAIIIFSYSKSLDLELMKKYLREANQKRQVASILILDVSDDLDKSWCSEFMKTKHFNDLEKLLVEVLQQVESIARQLLAFSLFDQKQRTTKDLNKEAASFLWFQVLVEALKKMPTNKNSLKDMINMCRSYYNTQRENYKDDIAEFENKYNPVDAVKWYTRDTFLYRLLNKALRTENATSLYLFRTFIVDLCDLLETEFKKLKGTEDELLLYRGQQMAENEIEKLRLSGNSLISTNGFFSTTRDEGIAKGFAKKPSGRSDLTPVLFRVRASTKLEKVVFADITGLSEFAGEQEVLFSIGAVFQIGKVEYDQVDKMYKVDMTATDEGSNRVTDLVNRSSESGTRMLFGELLLEMGKYSESQKYFEMMKSQMQSDDAESADIYHNLGRVYGYKGDFEKALQNFERAYDIRSKVSTSSDDTLYDTLNSLGVIYGEKGEYDKAKKKFKDAMSKIEKFQSTDEQSKTLHIAQSFSNIGWIHFLKGEYRQALDYHMKSLNQRKKFSGDDTLLLAENYSSIGGVHHALGDFDKATDNYNKALKIRVAKLPADHPSIALNYQAIGGVLHESGRYEDALEKYKRALEMRAKALGYNHSSVASVYKSIGGVYLDQGAYDQALKHYSRALEICMMTVSENHPLTGDCYHSLGMLRERQNRFDEAIKHYNKARHIMARFLPLEHPSITKVWISIANVKLRQAAYDESIKIYKVALENMQQVDSSEHPDIILVYNNFGVLCRLKTEYQEAEQYFKEALQMCEKSLSQEHPMKARVLHNMGDLYTDKKDFEKAVDYYKKAVDMRETTLPADDLSTASSYYNLACAYFEMNVLVKSLTYFERTLGIYEKQRMTDEKAIQRVNQAIQITSAALNIDEKKNPNAKAIDDKKH